MALTGSLGSPRSERCRRGDGDRRISRELVMPVGDHAFAVVEAGRNDDQVAGCRTDFDDARLSGIVRGDDPGDQPLRTALNGGWGNGENVVAGSSRRRALTDSPGHNSSS